MSITLPKELTDKQKVSKLLSDRIKSKLLAICPITGIALTMEVPAIEGIALEYKNPLAESGNFLKLAELPANQLLQLPASILAGLLLASLRDSNLIICPMTAAAQNLSLQSVHPRTIVECFRCFSSIAFRETLKAKRKILERMQSKDYDDTPDYRVLMDEMAIPAITLVPAETNYFVPKNEYSVTSVLKAFKEDCLAVLFPHETKEEEDLEEIYDEVESLNTERVVKVKTILSEAALRAKRTKEANQKELLQRGRKLLKALIEENILSAKLVDFLKIIFTGDYLFVAEETMKQRLSIALLKHNSQNAVELSRIVMDRDATNQLDSIFEEKEENKDIEETPVKKLSLKEILILRLHNKTIPIIKDLTQPTLQVEAENALDTLGHDTTVYSIDDYTIKNNLRGVEIIESYRENSEELIELYIPDNDSIEKTEENSDDL